MRGATLTPDLISMKWLPSPRLARLSTRILVTGLIGALWSMTFAQRINGFDPWWVELTRYLPYPFLLLAVVTALTLSFWIGLRWVAASVSTALLVLTVTMGGVWNRPGPKEGPGAQGLRVRLMTYNVKSYVAERQPDGFAKLGREVALHRPDIVMMQDVYGAYQRYLAVAKVDGLQFPFLFMADQYLVASRYPLSDCELGPIAYRDIARQYVRCTIDIDGTPVQLVNTHFVSPRDGLNAARHEGVEGLDEWRQNFTDRLHQSSKLAVDLVDVDRPLIVAGDFNAPESSPVVSNIEALGLRDAFSAAGRGHGYTYGHNLRIGVSVLRIDHILLSPEIGVSDSFIGGAAASDHRPVIADLRIPSRRAS